MMMFTFIPLLIDGGTYLSGMMIPGTVASLRAVDRNLRSKKIGISVRNG